jgi:hypothetical protein
MRIWVVTIPPIFCDRRVLQKWESAEDVKFDTINTPTQIWPVSFTTEEKELISQQRNLRHDSLKLVYDVYEAEAAELLLPQNKQSSCVVRRC